jgi:hypothetical protein
MSFNMWAVPMPKDPPSPQSFYDVKHAFARQFMNSDGSVRGECVIDASNRKVILIWLEGYAAGCAKDARKEVLDFRSLIAQNPQGVHVWIGDWLDGPYGDTTNPERDGDDDEGHVEASNAKQGIRSVPKRVELQDHQMFGSGN